MMHSWEVMNLNLDSFQSSVLRLDKFLMIQTRKLEDNRLPTGGFSCDVRVPSIWVFVSSCLVFPAAVLIEPGLVSHPALRAILSLPTLWLSSLIY